VIEAEVAIVRWGSSASITEAMDADTPFQAIPLYFVVLPHRKWCCVWPVPMNLRFTYHMLIQAGVPVSVGRMLKG
jgi:hypothetical protein